jgi:hypothetical protein
MHLNFLASIARIFTWKDCKCLYFMSVKIATASMPKKFFARHYVQEPNYIFRRKFLGTIKFIYHTESLTAS